MKLQLHEDLKINLLPIFALNEVLFYSFCEILKLIIGDNIELVLDTTLKNT